jgi:hypothetical protein
MQSVGGAVNAASQLAEVYLAKGRGVFNIAVQYHTMLLYYSVN